MRKSGTVPLLAVALVATILVLLLALASVDSTWAGPSSQGTVPSTGKTVYLPLIFATPLGFAVNSPNGMASTLDRLFISNRDQNTVTVWDENARVVLATIPVGQRPWGVAAYQSTVFIANFSGSPRSLSVINAGTLNKQADIDLSACPGQPSHIAVDVVNGVAYVAMYVPGSPGSVAVIDALYRSFVRCLPTHNGTFGIAVDPVLSRLYITNRDSLDLQVYDTGNVGHGNTLLQNIALGGQPYSVQSDSASGRVFVMVAFDGPDFATPKNLEIFDASSGTVPGAPYRTLVIGNTEDGGALQVSHATGQLYVAATASNQLWIVNPTTAATRVIPMPGPFVLAENSNLHRMYVGSRDLNTVTTESDALAP